MYCIRNLQTIFYSIVMGIGLSMLAGCSGGVQSGSTNTTFSGVQEATALSPTAVKLSWVGDASVQEYEVYTAGSSKPLTTTPFNSITLEGLVPDTKYVLKVIGKVNGKQLGAEKEISVQTWPRFDGIVAANTDINGNVTVSWSYDYTPVGYEIFWLPDAAPTVANTSNWATPNLRTTEKSVVIQGLQPSKKYYFIVHAQYREGEFEFTSRTIAVNTKSSFATPDYNLVSISVGTLPYMTVTPKEDAQHTKNFFKSQVFWNGSPVSDPLVGQGTIVFSSVVNLPIGKIDNLSLVVTYNDGKTSESLEIGGLFTYRKGVGPQVEIPTVSSLGLGPAYMGQAIATGDFNCDGADDVAIGLPNASFANIGQTQVNSGAVYIYYSKKVADTYVLQVTGTPLLAPVLPGVDPQMIAFDDMTTDAKFGVSLSSGNLNSDKNGQYACKDLIVGASGTTTVNGVRDGAAFVFFGSVKGLQAPTHMRDLQENVATCNGQVEGAICTAVKIWLDYSRWPTSKFGGPFKPSIAVTGSSGSTYNSFGATVSFIGDFNSDGYEDVAVGAPNAAWDGVANTAASGDSRYLPQVGFVAIYFGSKFGLGTEVPDATDSSLTGEKFLFLKIYPPVPEAYMHFGAAIAGGADVDGKFKVRLSDGTLAGGSDLVVGAPGFTYSDYINNSVLKNYIGSTPSSAAILNFSGGGWQANGVSLAAATSYYGISQDQGAATGAAFLYFGRGRGTAPGALDIENPTRSTFWKCGQRAMALNEHYSCLVSPSSFKMLSPRNNHSRGFGSALALMGDSSRFDGDNALITATNPDPSVPRRYFSDSNQDGYADVIVFASSGSSGGNTNTGNIWEFFGNPSNLFEAAELFNVYGDGVPVASKDFNVNNPSCASFATVSGATKQQCVPSTLESPSINAGVQMGASQRTVSAGDVTGDGINDLAVGLPLDSIGGSGSGSVLVFTSSSGKGLTSNYKKFYSSNSVAGNNFGSSVALGNLNGDFKVIPPPDGSTVVNTNMPYFDLVTGAPYDLRTRPGGGGVYGYLSNGASLPATRSNEDLFLTDSQATFQNYGFGSTRIVGDINGDGYDDAVSKATYYSNTGGVVYDAVIFFGSSQGLITTSYCLSHLSDVFIGSGSASDCYPQVVPAVGLAKTGLNLPQLIIRPNNLSGAWAQQAYGAGDVNNDGFEDVAFLQFGGSVVVYYGARGGLQNVVNPSWVPSVNDPQIVTGSGSTPTGYESGTDNLISTNDAIYIAHGDFNGDGYADFALADPLRSGPSMNKNLSDSTQIPRAEYGTSVNVGDGWYCSGANIEAECKNGGGPIYHGRVIVFFGSSRGVQTPSLNGLVAPGTDVSSGVSGFTSIYNTESGPKPCDSITDPLCSVVEIRNPVLENIDRGYGKFAHRFGASISVIDYNNDGIDDLTIGAPYYQDISCTTGAVGLAQSYGRVYLFQGSSLGLVGGARDEYYNYKYTESCPVDPANDPGLGLAAGSKLRALAPSLVTYGIASNSTSRRFGTRMTVAGDVNGDGFEDLLVAAPSESVPGITAVGGMYMFYGPICPMDNNLSVTQGFQQSDVSGVHLNKQMYFSGASPAGVSSDLIYTGPVGTVGSTCYRGAGGSMKPLPQKFYVGDASAGGMDYGMSVAGQRKQRGDFNGDGYDDVLVGSPYDTPDASGLMTSVGRGIVFFGHGNGLYAADFPANSVVSNSAGQLRPYIISPPFWNTKDYFFAGNLSAGDVNKDGTVDYLVPSNNFNGSGSFRGIGVGTFFIFY